MLRLASTACSSRPARWADGCVLPGCTTRVITRAGVNAARWSAGATPSDAALVRKHRKENTVLFAVVEAARRVFDASQLVGCSTDQIAALLAGLAESDPRRGREGRST